jgi:hypothetical protein
MQTDYTFTLPMKGAQNWSFDGTTLARDGAPVIAMPDVTEMMLRIGHDMELTLSNPGKTVVVHGPAHSKPDQHVIWVGLAKELLRALPEEAALVTRPKLLLQWLARAVILGAAIGGLVMAASNGFEIGAAIIGLAIFGMGLFLGWSTGAFDGARPLDRGETTLKLTNMSVHLSREGHNVPILRPGQPVASPRLPAFAKLGAVSDDVLAPILSANLTGQAPPWPEREAHRLILPDDGTALVVTDGLTSPYEDGRKGLPYELLMTLPEDGLDDVGDLSGRAEFGLFREIAFNALAWGDLREPLAQYGAMSTEIPTDAGTAYALDDDQGPAVGLMLGPLRPAPGETAWQLLPVLVLLPGELEHIRTGGAEARNALTAAMAEMGGVTRPDRAALIAGIS